MQWKLLALTVHPALWMPSAVWIIKAQHRSSSSEETSTCWFIYVPAWLLERVSRQVEGHSFWEVNSGINSRQDVLFPIWQAPSNLSSRTKGLRCICFLPLTRGILPMAPDISTPGSQTLDSESYSRGPRAEVDTLLALGLSGLSTQTELYSGFLHSPA